jgi:nucleotide-binding universal stress UspA family protein
MKALIQTVLVAVSGSSRSVDAAKYGIALARAHRARLLAAYVVDTATLRELLLSRIFVEDESADYERSLEQNGQRYLDYVGELARKKGVTVEKVLRKGSVSTEILSIAEEYSANVILLGAFEAPTALRDVIGRQHREILRNAKCSVIVVKEKNIDELYKSI